MAHPLKAVIAGLPAHERRKIKTRAAQRIAEEMSRQALRKAIGKTQTAIGKRLKVRVGRASSGSGASRPRG